MPRPFLIFLNPLYWAIVFVRNLFYDLGFFNSKSFNQAIIVLGNLSTGGTGKTPHTEYVVNLLKEKVNVAVLSRGYRRKTTGFLYAKVGATAQEVGDEPAQIKMRFPNVTVAVDADRVNGVSTLLRDNQTLDAIVLDDAFQHRKLQAGFYILLTPYHLLYPDDILLPAGNLREPKSGAQRAQIIVVTKCPKNVSTQKKEEIIKKLKPKPYQHVYFSAIDYGEIESETGNFNSSKPFLLVTGIADAQPMVSFLEEQKHTFTHLNYPDHHHFTDQEIEKVIEKADSLGKRQILTTEKDYQRLPLKQFKNAGIEVAFLPITIAFLSDGEAFDQQIVDYVKAYDLGQNS